MKKLIILIATFCLFFFSVTLVSAHPSLIRADPPANSVLAVSPPSITLWFDEDLDPQFSTVTLLDKNQKGVDLKNVKVSADRKQMSVGVQPNLPPGAYTVSWRVFSAVDGHIIKGVFAIFVGAASVGQTVPLNPTNAEANLLPLPLDVLVRWLNLLAALALCGALTLKLLMGESGSLDHASERFAEMRTAAARRLRIWVLINVIVLFVGTIISQLLQAAAASDRSLGEVLTQSIWLQTLTTTRFGQAGLARIVLVDALLVLFGASGGQERWRIKRLWNARALDLVYFAIGALILLSFSLSSHAAASNDPLKLAVFADWLHLLAIGAWTGGLFALTLVLRPTVVGAGLRPAPTETLLIILRRFSNVAIGSVALFTLTGLYSMWRQVGYANALVSTPYGATLIIKNIMIVPLLLIGAINTLLLRPELLTKLRIASGELRIFSRFSPSANRNPQFAILGYVRVEAILGGLVVLAAATLTALPPARTAVPPPLPPPFEMTRVSDGVSVSLRVEPYVVGNDTFEVKVSDPQGNPLPNVTRVNLRFTFLGADLGTSNAEMQPVGNGVYKLEGGNLSVVGAWKVETIVRRKDVADDVRIAYRLNVIDPLSSRGDEVPNVSSSLVFAIFDLIAGTALLIYSRRKNIAEGKWIGVGALALGVVLFMLATFFTPSVSAGVLVNPIPPDENSLAQGKAIYEANCAVCHGPTGRGNGPLAATLNPRPADFILHINQHPDEVLFNWISKGMPGTAMAAWEDKLTETQRWHVLNYVQALVERVTTPTPAAASAPTNTSATDAQTLLVKSDAAMNQLRSLVEVQRLGDDSGHVITTAFQFAAPDKLHFKLNTGEESIAIGDTQYYLEPGQTWEKRQRAEPLRWPNFDNANTALDLKVVGQEVIDGESCAIIGFKTAKVEYRDWIGERTGWLRKQQMDGPGHHMLSTFSQFNEPITIVAPPMGN